MQFKTVILSIALIFGGAFTAAAQTNNNAHHNAHNRLQARNVSPIERQATNSVLEQEIAMREQGISAETNKLLDDILKEANSHLGKPYVWAAKGPKAFDCSGFTSYVYRQFGYNITPASRSQQYEGKPVKREEMRKGDIMCFTSPRNGHKGVGHVGIVYSVDPDTGAIKFIHAGSKGIAIQDFNANYQRRFVCARRIINED